MISPLSCTMNPVILFSKGDLSLFNLLQAVVNLLWRAIGLEVFTVVEVQKSLLRSLTITDDVDTP